MILQSDSIVAALSDLEEGRVTAAREMLAPLSEGLLTEDDPTPEKNSVAWWRDIAQSLAVTGYQEAAFKAWEEAGRRGLPDFVVRTGQVEAALIVGEGERYLNIASTLVDEHPMNPIIAHLYAVNLLQAGKTTEAFSAWERCLSVSAQVDCPFTTEPVRLALAMMEIETFLFLSEPFIESLPGDVIEKESVEVDVSSFKKVLRTAARLLDKEDRVEEALTLLESFKGTLKAREEVELAAVKAEAHARRGAWDAMRVHLGAVLDGKETNLMIGSFYGYALARAGDTEAAIALLVRVPQEGPDDYFANYFIGVAHLLASRKKSGEEALLHRLYALHAFCHAFRRYFFDTYHSIVVPQWRKALQLAKAPMKIGG